LGRDKITKGAQARTLRYDREDMSIDNPNHLHFWLLLTRLGEIQILVPAALLTVLALLRRPDTRRLAFWWIVLALVATTLTTASKIAFIGWGIGSAELNFTGISGHAMFAAAVYPLLLGTLASQAPPAAQRLALVTGFALALLVGLSRLEIGVHSASEVVAGLLLGGAVSTSVLALARLPRAVISPLIPGLVAVWLMVMPVHAPPLPTHALVTQLSLSVSGNKSPHTRSDLLREPLHPQAN
jgi:membrane-associated phospholipid phosphatase